MEKVVREEHDRESGVVDDNPIMGREEDRLGRTKLSSQIARCCKAELGPEGRTFAVTGEWGTGKTSCLRMAVEELLRSGMKGRVVWFNAWMWGDPDSLVRELLQTVAGPAEPPFWRRWIGRRTAKAVGGLGEAAAWAGEVAALTSADGGAGAAATLAGKALRRLAAAWDQGGKGTLQGLKEELAAAHKACEKARFRTVVMIDDVDRLEPKAVLELLRAVRLVGQLPHVVYVVALDSGSVATTLDNAGHRGADYLQKIFEFEIRVPQLQREQGEQLLWQETKGIVEGSRGRMDDNAETDLAKSVRTTAALLHTPRQVKRYLMSLAQAMACTPNEVRASEVALLQGLRTATPKVVDAIAKYAGGLTTEEYGHPEGRKGEARPEVAMKAVVDAAPENLKGIVEQAISALFPYAARAVEAKEHGTKWETAMSSMDEPRRWRRLGRVADRDVLEAALAYRTTEELHLTTARKALIAGMADRATLEAMLLGHGHDLEHVLGLIEAITDPSYRASEEHARAAVPVLMEALREREKEDWRQAMRQGASTTVGRAVAKLIGWHHPDEDDKGLNRLVETVRDLGGQARVLRWTRDQVIGERVGSFTTKHLEAAEDAWMKKVRATSSEDVARWQALSEAAELAQDVAARTGEPWKMWTGAAVTRQMVMSAACESVGWSGVPGEDGMRQSHRRLELHWARLEKGYGSPEALAEALAEAREEDPQQWAWMNDLGEVALEYQVGRRMDRFNEQENQRVRITFGDEMNAQIERLRQERTREELCTQAMREGHLDPSVGPMRGLGPGKPTYRHEHAIRVRVGPRQQRRAERLAKDLQVSLGEVWGTILAAGLDRIEKGRESSG